MQLWKARKIAEDVVHMLSPYCEIIVVCGSIRRGKPDGIKDIDLVILPRITTVENQPALFEDIEPKHVEVYDMLLEHLHQRKELDVGVSVVSVGQTRHKLHHEGEGIDIELYTVNSPAKLGVAVAFRTGPSTFSARLATVPLNLHWHIADHLLHMHEKGGRPGNRIACPLSLECDRLADTQEESQLFDALGLSYPEPETRTLELLLQMERQRLAIHEDSRWE